MTLGPNSRCVFRLTGFNVCWRQLSCGSKVNPNELPLSNDRLTNTMVILGFPGGSDSEESESPAMRETWVQSLGLEDPLQKGRATHSSILAWRIPRTEKPGGLQFTGSQRVRHKWATNIYAHAWLKIPYILPWWSLRMRAVKLDDSILSIIKKHSNTPEVK